MFLLLLSSAGLSSHKGTASVQAPSCKWGALDHRPSRREWCSFELGARGGSTGFDLLGF